MQLFIDEIYIWKAQKKYIFFDIRLPLKRAIVFWWNIYLKLTYIYIKYISRIALVVCKQ